MAAQTYWSSTGRLILVIAGIAVLVAGGAVLAAGAFLDSLPTAVTANVRDGQQDVPLDQVLVFGASRPLLPAAFRSALSISPAVEGTLTASDAGTSFMWTPSRAWSERTQYTVHVTPFRDTGGHEVAERTWRFTTTLLPQVTSLATRFGTIVTDNSQIGLGTPLRLTFNTAMDQPTVRLLANGSPLGLSWTDDDHAADVDVRPLRIGPVSFSIGPGARDRAGRPLAGWRLEATIVPALADGRSLSAAAG